MDIAYKLQIERKDVDQEVDKHDQIYIYGIGVVGAIAYDYFCSRGKDVEGFVVSKRDERRMLFRSKPVLLIDEAVFDGDFIVVVAVSEKYKVEISKILQDKLKKEYDSRVIYFGIYESEQREWYYAGTTPCGSYFENFQELDRIGVETGTDKSSRFHNYLHKYEFFLKKWRDKKFNFLELGVFRGESLRMWKEYFKNAQIIGVDIDESCRKFNSDQVEVIITDLSVIQNYEQLRRKKPEVIVDDALHSYSQQIRAFSELFGALSHGGVYIVEDLGTSFGEFKKTVSNDLRVTAYEYFSALAELVTGHEMEIHTGLQSCYEMMEEQALGIDMISFVFGSCIIVKK